MRNILGSFLALLGVGLSAQAQLPQNTQMMDPKSVLFSLLTISEDIPAVEPPSKLDETSNLLIHEDDWAHVEFLPRSMFEQTKHMLREFKEFERVNRVGAGWKNVYVRKINRTGLLNGVDATKKLEVTVGAARSRAPVITAASKPAGRVKNGFTIPLGGNVSLYGVETPAGISVLGASVGEKPDDSKLARAFMQLNGRYGLILVDWRSQMILHGANARGQVESWRP